jgi:DNA polymerase III alpha subunit
MTPLFKTQYSIGKSILNVDDVVDIAQYNSLKEVVCVEDSFYGFRSLKQKLSEEKLKFIFGIRLPVVQNSKDTDLRPSKLVFFAKNNNGISKLRSLYTEAFTSEFGCVSLSNYDKSFFENVRVVVPFYDSFIYNNLFHFGLCELSLEDIEHEYLIEDNNHPFDFQIKRVINSLGVKTSNAKSIYYRNKEDFHAFQMHKAVCSRTMGRSPKFSNPNLDHFCSDDFCWESYKEKTSQ